MTPQTLPARERQRLDALIDRPLRAFRTELARLTDRDLELLQARLEARLAGAHLSRGAHGMARHLAGQELPLLERRLSLVTAQRAMPQARQLRLVEPGVHAAVQTDGAKMLDELEERQAA